MIYLLSKYDIFAVQIASKTKKHRKGAEVLILIWYIYSKHFKFKFFVASQRF